MNCPLNAWTALSPSSSPTASAFPASMSLSLRHSAAFVVDLFETFPLFSRYTSYLSPICTPKLHNELLGHKDPKHIETPYVVMLHNACRLSTIAPCFRFVHPNPACSSPEGPDNSRYEKVSFKIEQSGLMHGFGAYFEAVLYKDVMISINPDTHSPGMFSWFPMYFPIQTPVYLPKDSVVDAHFWRKVSRTRVWYEWAITSPAVSRIHNARGEANFIGL
eukprot:m.61864 g.61864  ORF g.61864 m.61864 type:complete len:219 (+) comp16226_c0_seq3:1310-1966(+)